ncbi:MAG: SdrD B-like domain-containing protein [Bacteroidota bacterium]
MKKLYLVLVILSCLLCTTNVFAQAASITWPLTSTINPNTPIGNIQGTAESIHAGSGQFGMSVFDYTSDGQRLWEGTAGWIAGTEEATRYIQFDVSPTSGNSFTVTRVSFNYGDFHLTTNSNTLNFTSYYSTDNWTTRNLMNPPLLYFSTAMLVFNAPNMFVPVANGQTFSFRIYPYAVQNSIAGTPTFAIHNNLVIEGTTAPAISSGSICGIKFNDLNGDGLQNNGELGIPNFTINLTNNLLAGSVNLTTTTDANGNYCFNNLQAGTYTVSETNPGGWLQTFPASPGTQIVALATNQHMDNINFGNKRDLAAACITWNLLDSTLVTSTVGNITGLPETMGTGSPTLSTGFPANLMSIYGYSSNGQELWVGNTGGTWVPDPPGTPLPDPARFIQFNVSPNSGNTYTVTNVSFNYGDDPNIVNFNILAFQAYYSTNGWITKTLLNSTPLVYLNLTMSTFNVSGLNVPIASGQTFSLRIYMYPVLHGITIAPTFAIHNNVVICGTTTPEVIKTGSICGMKFNDLNGNGVKDKGEPGLPGWQIGLNIAAIPPVMTDSLGNYCFNNLPAGTYTVAETNQNGWQQTAPPSPGTYTVTLTSGQNLDSLNFGNKMVSTLGCVEPPSGMVAWWPLDETSGSTSIDLAGFNNSGTQINGPVPVPAKVLGGLRFDGQNDYVQVPDHSELNFGTGDFSIDAWIKTSDSINLKIIVDKQTLNGYNYQGYSFYLNYGYLTVQLADGVPPTYFTNWSPFVFVADGNWHHVAVTVSRSNHNGNVFYKDGVATQFGDPTVRSGSLTTTSPLTIGRQSYTDQFEFNGILDEIELFNRVLTPQEIGSIFAAGSAGKCKPSVQDSCSTKAWSPLGTGINNGTNGEVWALAVIGSDLYVGGNFTTAGSNTVNHIAKWNGSSWSPLISSSTSVNGINGMVTALAVIGTDLYAGGWFTTAGGIPAENIAKWDGTNWSALGSGLPAAGAINALAAMGNNLYATSYILTPALGGPGNLIAKWDGANWSPFSVMNDYVSSFLVDGSDLYAGGQFTIAGTVPANHIAKWDGTNWSPLGLGTNYFIGGTGLEMIAGNLYVGGRFTTAGGNTANFIAKWNGSVWSSFGTGSNIGMDNAVEGLAVMGTDLYASGSFTTAEGVSANSVAKWDGTNWSPLGSGMNNGVWRLAVIGNDLYAGGIFTTAGGVNANYIAKYSCGIPTSVSGDKTENTLPQRYKLEQNYPNPFNPTTQIAYEIASEEFVSLRIFNSLGQQVAVLVNGQRPAGAYTVTFRANDLPSGMYFYRLIAGKFQQTRKMLLLK